MGLGPLQLVPLARAREQARDIRMQRYRGVDPLGARGAKKKVVAAEVTGGPTFAEAMVAYIDANKAAWRNEKHIAQWSSTLSAYAAPHLGKKRLVDIETADVLAAVQPI